MINCLLVLLFLARTPVLIGEEPTIPVCRTYTDDQLAAVEHQVLNQFGLRVKLRVIQRNGKKEITQLAFIRYAKNGRKASSCTTDAFSGLLITPTGCTIMGSDDPTRGDSYPEI